jgi:hypothetical protein
LRATGADLTITPLSRHGQGIAARRTNSQKGPISGSFPRIKIPLSPQ